MNRATKAVLAVGGIIVLSYPGVAWVTGIAIESRIQHSEQQALDRVPYLTLLRRDYHRGVYRSTEVATYGFRSPLPQSPNAAAASALAAAGTITVTSDIQHGPFPGLRTVGLGIVDTTVSAPPALQKELSGRLGPKPILRIHTTIGLLGGATADLTSPAFKAQLSGGSRLTWGGLTGTFTTVGEQGRGRGQLSGQLSAPRLAFHDAQGGIELVGIEYSGSYATAFRSLDLGTGTFTIERIDGSSPRTDGDFSLRRISLISTSKADGEFFDMRVDLAMDAARLATLQLKNVVYAESFEHVHGPSLASMAQAIRGAERQAGANPAQLQAGMQDAFRQYGVDLLLHDPVIDIRQVSFTMPEGSVHFSARVSAPGLSRADLQWPAAIAALKAHAQVTADLRVDNGLVQKLLTMGSESPKLAARLTSFERLGYLTAGSGAVTTHLKYGAGRLTLNGHAFPPAPPAN